MTRHSLAWRCRPNWSSESDVFYAPTRSKARYQALKSWRDSFPEMQITEIQVRRAAANDIYLPVPHRLLSELSAEDRRVIGHAFGWHNWRIAGYRSHYCTAPSDQRMLRLAWQLGLFDGPHGEPDAYGHVQSWSGAFFYLTELGQLVARSMLPDYPSDGWSRT